MSAATAQGDRLRPAEGSQTNQCRINLSPIANAARGAPAGRFGLLARPARAESFGASQDLASVGTGWLHGLKATQRL